MKLIPSINIKTASVMTITALAMASTSILPAQANDNGPNVAEAIGRIAVLKAARGFVQNRNAARAQQTLGPAFAQYTGVYNQLQTTSVAIENCFATNCSELGALLIQGNDLLRALPDPSQLPVNQ